MVSADPSIKSRGASSQASPSGLERAPGQQKKICESSINIDSYGMANPAAVYCHDLGYEYKIVDTDRGQKGICIFPDKSECEEWQFLTGKCGQEYSYCARQGYDLIVKTDGKNPFSRHYAVCVRKKKEIGSVTDLFGLSKKATRGSISIEQTSTAPEERVSTMSLPDSFDWRDKNGEDWMTSVKNQGTMCGSCWAFASIGVVEAMYNIRKNNPNLDLDLSEQQLISNGDDCCTGCGSCSTGGFPNIVFEYIKNEGVVDEDCFPNKPYQANVPCELCGDWESRLEKIDDYGPVSSNQQTIKQHLIEKGPLVTSIFMNEVDSFWDEDILRCFPVSLNRHNVIITGYKDTGFLWYEGYWIAKNSWGIGWDGTTLKEPDPHDGYFFVGYGECGVEEMIYYADKGYVASCGETITDDTLLIANLTNCPEDGLIIGASDITLDCAGRFIDGDNTGLGIGIYLDNKDGVTIKNCNVQEFYHGIALYQSSYNNLTGNTANDNDGDGVFLYTSSYNNLIANTANYNGANGFFVAFNSNNNALTGNTANYNGWDGIYLAESSYNDVTSNELIGNNNYGASLGDSDYNNYWNNTFIDNEENAYETDKSTNNNWNLSDVGNYWSDLLSNPGLPNYYEIPGDGDGKDYHPLNDDDNDGVPDYIDNCPNIANVEYTYTTTEVIDHEDVRHKFTGTWSCGTGANGYSGASCGWGVDSFDLWYDFVSPASNMMRLQFKPGNLITGPVDYYIVTGECGGAGTLVWTVASASDCNIITSDEIDLGDYGINPGEPFYLRIRSPTDWFYYRTNVQFREPYQPDADADGVGDACDNCWYVPNPDQADTWGVTCPSPPYYSDPKCGDACEVVTTTTTTVPPGGGGGGPPPLFTPD